MKVFISWSGQKSKALAEVFRKWLPAVIQAVEPYFTPDDIDKGARWNTEIARELESSSVGLICLTPENLEAPWIMFEAGALSKNIDESRVIAILFEVESTDLKGPLVQFQNAKFEKPDIRGVVRVINQALGDSELDGAVLDRVFKHWWPDLESEVHDVLENLDQSQSTELRPDRDILEEILERIRLLAQTRPTAQVNPATVGAILIAIDELANVIIDTSSTTALAEPFFALVRAIESLVDQYLPIESNRLDRIARRFELAKESELIEEADIPF